MNSLASPRRPSLAAALINGSASARTGRALIAPGEMNIHLSERMHDRNRTLRMLPRDGRTDGRTSSAGDPPFMFNFGMEIPAAHPVSVVPSRPIEPRKEADLAWTDRARGFIPCEISVFGGWRYCGYLCSPGNRARQQSGENL